MTPTNTSISCSSGTKKNKKYWNSCISLGDTSQYEVSSGFKLLFECIHVDVNTI